MTVDRLVRNDVIHRANALVSELMSNEALSDKYLDQILEVTVKYSDDSDYFEEALEFWIVSDYLAKKLSEKGELVTEIFDFHIWGRTTSGQAIVLDSVMQEIAESL